MDKPEPKDYPFDYSVLILELNPDEPSRESLDKAFGDELLNYSAIEREIYKRFPLAVIDSKWIDHCKYVYANPADAATGDCGMAVLQINRLRSAYDAALQDRRMDQPEDETEPAPRMSNTLLDDDDEFNRDDGDFDEEEER